jgi:predicted metal-dependent phosphotriesterase family hydrolase
MKAIDMSPIIKKYRGYFVALSWDRKKVFAKGHTPEEVIKKAKRKGIKEPVIAKIPEDCRSYLL